MWDKAERSSVNTLTRTLTRLLNRHPLAVTLKRPASNVGKIERIFVVPIVVPTCPGVVSERSRIIVGENKNTTIATMIVTKIKNDEDRDDDRDKDNRFWPLVLSPTRDTDSIHNLLKSFNTHDQAGSAAGAATRLREHGKSG